DPLMLTAIVSDLHLGTRTRADVLRLPEPRRRLIEAIAPADRIVLLGDLLELREQRAAAVLEAAAPLLDELGDATAGKQVVIVPGNHDHQLAGPALDRSRLAGDPGLRAESTFSTEHSGLALEVAGRMPRTEVVLAYPGIRLRDDVYATHGHYLDLHMTVPRLECVIGSVVARFAGTSPNGRPTTPEAYEAALAPIYAFAYSVAQNSEARAATRGGTLSRHVWRLSSPDRRRSLGGLALGGLAVPLAVGALNLMGLGPFRPDLSGSELRRAGLRAAGEVVRALGIDAEHVIFGHTHRPGPLPGDGEEWRVRDGGPWLTNTGSWLHESVFVGSEGPASPYWPGTVVLLGDDGAPEVTNVLRDVELRLPGTSSDAEQRT
ncbi:MAG: metallophosphoesterase family protein, partial [Actinomycetota bacterium]|nr:metallophosphoesterase family protein [Actinomycetota bacterium]